MKKKIAVLSLPILAIIYCIIQLVGLFIAIPALSNDLLYLAVEIIMYVCLIAMLILFIVFYLKGIKNKLLWLILLFVFILIYEIKKLIQAIIVFVSPTFLSNTKNEIALFIIIPLLMIATIITFSCLIRNEIKSHRTLPVNAE
ncbi:MAG: hypothetical protein IJX25_00300 [Clostridia bacterium]|nr:hypothetical protein [Clostridia bacterium]